jgi:hypothetical protein
MRRLLCSALMVGMAALSPRLAQADEDAGLKELIDKAIVAQGGREKLTKYKAFTLKMKGKANAQGQMFDFTMELKVQEPDKSNFKMDFEIAGMPFNVTQVVNGDMGWMRVPGNNEVVPLSKDQLAEEKEQSFGREIENLIGLNDKKYKLAPLGESKVGDNDVIGIRVSSQGHRDVSLYFDKQSHLLLKSETTAKDPMMGDKEFAQETLYSDYKEASGLKYASKMTIKRDGMDFMTGDITEWTPSEKLDDNVFAKP